MVRVVQKAKAETNKSVVGDKSPSRSSTRDKSSSRVLRKSPSRSETVTSKEVASKSPARRSPSRKSPSRKSPSRRSPSRRSPIHKSPARKSPSRKSPTRASPTAKSSLSRKAPITRLNKKLFDLDSDSDETELDHINTEKPKATVRGRARKSESEYFLPKVLLQDIQSSVVQDVSNIGVVLRSSTKLPSNDVERVVHLKNDLAVKKLTEFSDEDDIPLKRRSISVREQSEDLKFKTEADSWLGALIGILTIPTIFFILYALCNETHCKFTQLPNLNKFKHLSSWFDSNAFLIYHGYIFLVAILSAIPIGGRKVFGVPNKQGKLNYVMNGLFIAIVTSALLVSLEYYKVPVISHIFDKYFQLLITAAIVGVLISIYLYAHSFYVPISALNPHAISNSKIYNFFIGREINPRIYGKFDMKIFLFRIFVITMLLLNSIFVYKSLQFTGPIEIQNYNLKGVKYNPTLLVIGALQIFYMLDILIFEKAILTTFDIQYEALGYMSTVSMLAGSFITPLITKSVYDCEIKLPIWHLSAAVVVYLVGYILYRGSNNQKHTFRINPLDPAVAHLEKIPTAQGKKLLVSGYWGFVRHPNYLGDILMFLSFASFVWKTPAVLICIIDIVFLIQRSHRDGKRCKERYGSAWNRYCQRVKYVLIPKIY